MCATQEWCTQDHRTWNHCHAGGVWSTYTMHIHRSNVVTETGLPYIPICIVCIVANLTSVHWHCYSDRSLTRGVLISWVKKCKVRFHIYTPHDLHACPCIIVAFCQNPHTHAPPAPVKLLLVLQNELSRLLHDMGWHLADTTPQQIMLDSGFIHRLWNVLGWESNLSPSLSDLHPSLANLDYVWQCISELCNEKFLYGTGFEGKTVIF